MDRTKQALWWLGGAVLSTLLGMLLAKSEAWIRNRGNAKVHADERVVAALERLADRYAPRDVPLTGSPSISTAFQPQHRFTKREVADIDRIRCPPWPSIDGPDP